jgi:hypothetical protein
VLAAACLLLVFDAERISAALLRRRRAISVHHSSTISQRKRLNVNDIITEPGTAEIDSGYLYSYTTGSVTLPSAVKITPDGDSFWWGRTEYSVAFDSIASAVNTGDRSTQFSDRLTFAATSILFDSPHFDVAVSPLVTTLLRNDNGVRWGATVIARFDNRGNSVGATAGWTAATVASDTNPAGVWDFGAGYGRALGTSGLLQHVTPHINVNLEKATGFTQTTSIFGGVEYQFNEHLALDVSGQRFSLIGANPDRQLFLGLTINVNQPHRRKIP